jgi:hypothetical protein
VGGVQRITSVTGYVHRENFPFLFISFEKRGYSLVIVGILGVNSSLKYIYDISAPDSFHKF